MAVSNINTGVFNIDDNHKKTLANYLSYSRQQDIGFDDGSLFMAGFAGGTGLGINCTSIDRSSPIQIPGCWKTGHVAHSSSTHAGAIKCDGTLWKWGLDSNGVLGQNSSNYGGNTVANKSSPVQIPGTTWCQVTGGYQWANALKTNGTLWTWGNRANIGNMSGSSDNKSSPIQIPGTWKDVKGSCEVRALLCCNGTMVMSGLNNNGQIGCGDTTSPVTCYVLPGTWCRTALGATTAGGIKTDGTMWIWGQGFGGSHGQNDVVSRSVPVQVPGLWKEIAIGNGPHTIGIRSDGTSWAWGYNSKGQLGLDNSNIPVSSPVQIPGCWSYFCTGGSDTFGFKPNGTMWSFGYDLYGELATNKASYGSPVQVPGTWLNASVQTPGVSLLIRA